MAGLLITARLILTVLLNYLTSAGAALESYFLTEPKNLSVPAYVYLHPCTRILEFFDTLLYAFSSTAYLVTPHNLVMAS